MQKQELLVLVLFAILILPAFTIAFCGDGIIEDEEQCDGANLNEMTCENLDKGYIGGELKCTLDCRYESGNCVFDVIDDKQKDTQNSGLGQEGLYCGNGIIEGNEKCDGANFNSKTCETLGYESGELSCTSDCVYDLSYCDALLKTTPNIPDLVQKDNEGNLARTIGENAIEYAPLAIVFVLIIFVIYLTLTTRTSKGKK